MLEALTYQEMLKDIIKNSERYGIENDTIGILLTRPDLETGRDILESLEYYHFRTGKMINFYLPGYGAYWNDWYPDGKVVTKLNGVSWSFSNRMFVEFIEELECYSKWEYSGESELILLSYSRRQISYEKVMIFHLDQMLRDKVISSVHNFLEQLFRICKDEGTLSEVCGSARLDKAKQIAMNRILEKIPKGLNEIFKYEKYFSLKNISR